MLHSATLKLTGWYLLILMSISLLFSITVYNATTSELDNRLSDLTERLDQPDTIYFNDPNPRLFMAYQDNQRDITNRNILGTLLFVNMLILSGGGALSYWLARRTLSQLEQSHQTQSRFVSDASHELRTPLAAMKSELEVALRDSRLTKNQMRELLQSSLEEVDKLTSLSKTLLQLSRLDHANIEIEQINLAVVASEVVQRYDKNAMRINLDLPSKPLIIKGNPASIEELFTILVDNALKYSPENSKVTAKLMQQGRHALFVITNPGRGIPADKLPYIFDRFYRADTSRSNGGSGLGLALAKEIVSLHKGELSVSSATKKTTTFRVHLPLLKKK